MTEKFKRLFKSQKRWIDVSSDILGKQQSDILIAAGIIMFSYAGSMVLGLIRQRLLGALFFDCCKEELDVYKAAFRLPDMLFQILVVGTFSATFIPLFSEQLQISKKRAYEFAHTTLFALTIILLAGSILVLLFARPLSQLLTGNFSSEQIDLMVQIIPYLLGAQFIFLASQWIGSILQSNHRFLAPAISPFMYNTGIIIGIIFLSPHYGIFGPVYGGFIGALLHLAVQIPASKSLPVIRPVSINFSDPLLRKIFTLSIPRMIALAVSELELTVTVRLATSLASSSLFLYDLASQLRLVPVQVVAVAIGQAALPTLSSYSYTNKHRFKYTLSNTLHEILYLVLPITAIVLILRIPIVRLAFGSPTFPWPATTQTAWTLAMFSLAIPAFALFQMLIRGFYALKDTTTPLYTNIFGFAIFSVLGYFFTYNITEPISIMFIDNQVEILKPYDIRNIALAVSIASTCKLFLAIYLLNRKIKFINQEWITEIGRLVLATIIMSVAMWQLFTFLDDELIFNTTQVIPLIAFTITVACLALAVYLVSCHFLRSTSQNLIWGMVIKFPGFKKVLDRTQAWIEPISNTPQT